MQIEPLKPWAWPNIHPWPPGDRTAVHSHVSFDGGKTFVARNHVGEHLPEQERPEAVSTTRRKG